jgi:hypothetical protein
MTARFANPVHPRRLQFAKDAEEAALLLAE